MKLCDLAIDFRKQDCLRRKGLIVSMKMILNLPYLGQIIALRFYRLVSYIGQLSSNFANLHYNGL